MEDVLKLYARPPDVSEPVVCLDERPVVRHDDARQGLGVRCCFGPVLRIDRAARGRHSRAAPTASAQAGTEARHH
jgi:hypothetical protein